MGANFTDISAGQDGENIGFATLMKQGANLMMNLELEDGRDEEGGVLPLR